MSLLDSKEITTRLVDLAGWEYSENQISKTYKLSDFAHALLFIGAIGQYAEAADHHPDLHLYGYNKVRVTLSTHSAGGVTAKDFTLAALIEALPHKKPK